MGGRAKGGDVLWGNDEGRIVAAAVRAASRSIKLSANTQLRVDDHMKGACHLRPTTKRTFSFFSFGL